MILDIDDTCDVVHGHQQLSLFNAQSIAARVIETASRVRLAFAACCPEADLFRELPGALTLPGPLPPGHEPLSAIPIPPARLQQYSSSRGKKSERSRAAELKQSQSGTSKPAFMNKDG